MESKTKPFLESKWYLVYLALTALIIGTWLYANLVLHVCFVSGESMTPTLNDGDVLRCETEFGIEDIRRGDVVMIDTGREHYIKRVIVLPGESAYIENGQVYVGKDGVYFLSGYEYEPIENGGILPTGKQDAMTLSDNQFFCMGDNRNDSIDCREFGPITFEQIDRIVKEKLMENFILM